jgi:hypothetical protein
MALASELSQAELKQLFERLAEQWHEETGMYSIARQKVSHPAYLRIIGLGRRTIPLILHDMEVNGGWWFDALEALTGENPAAGADRSKPLEMQQAWVAWASLQGIVPEK